MNQMIWLDQGLMVDPKLNGDISAIYFRKRGFFKKWQILLPTSPKEDKAYVFHLLRGSEDKKGKYMKLGSPLMDVESFRTAAYVLLNSYS